MKLVSFEKDGIVAVGAIGSRADVIVPISALGFSAQDMTALIREVNGTFPADLTATIDKENGLPLADCHIIAPIKYPAQDIICLGVNYYEHRVETEKSDLSYDTSQTATIFFSKRVCAAVDPDGMIDGHFDIVDGLDYEAELAVIIGKDAKKVARDDAQQYIFGYTILNDISARNLQSRHQQWYFGKSLDDFTPIGPWIVTRDAVEWPPRRAIRSYVNGELRQNSNTERMIAGIADVISQLSQGMTLKAGTIIAMGTPSGVGMGFDPPRYMRSGDIIRCEIDGIGALENTIQ